MPTFEVKLSEEYFVKSWFRMRQYNADDKTGLRRWLAIHVPFEFKWVPATSGDAPTTRRRPLVGTSYIIAMMLILALPLLLIDPAQALRMAGKILLVLALGLLAIVILLLLISRYASWNFKKTIRQAPLFNSTILLQFDQSGLCTRSLAATEFTAWSAFPAVCRFDDGFLLQKPGNEFIWLPYAAITGGSQNEAEQLVRENIADYRIYDNAK